MDPWTQRLSTSWLRSLRFYERRYEVLREFEEAGLLGQFRVGEEEVNARLGDANHSISFGVLGLEGKLYQRDADESRLRSAIESVLKALQPEGLTSVDFAFQWVAPIEGVSYDDARQTAAAIAAPLAPAQPTDFALVSNVALGEPAANMFLECGIVDSGELPPRLARQVGRIGPPDPTAPPSLWPLDMLPEVAFFCDCFIQVDCPIESHEDLFHLLEGTRGACGEVVSQLMTHFGVARDE